tara:strand:+ start:5736 stop:5963 length:228 start_codon:yes stop_codon:yes gene_type:complete
MRFDANRLKEGPTNPDTDLPKWVEWDGERFETPSFEEIRGWVFDSTCESLAGETVEPDGVDPDGFPSWLLAVGLV